MRARELLQLFLPFLQPQPEARAPRRPRPRKQREAPPVVAPVVTPAGACANEDVAAERGDRADRLLQVLWDRSAASWSQTWGVPDLRATVRVELSRRMRSSLGGFYPKERLIRVADTLLHAPPALLAEVLCHEAAHAAVHVLHGDRARSHGREWRELMRAIGRAPRVRIPREEIGLAAQRAARKRWAWRHRCPTCRAQRVAGRPVKQWRCASCQAAGRSGKLAITRVPATGI